MLRTPSEEELLALKGQRMPLLELLTCFNTRVRNDQAILHIERLLKDAGLSTLPYFATCSSQSEVHIVAREVAVADQPADEEQEDEAGLLPGALPQQPFRIGDLPCAHAGVDSVTPDSDLTDATYIMHTRNYSQVPVLEDQYTVTGVVSWRSLAKVYATGQDAVLSNAIVEDPPVAHTTDDFFATLSTICEHGYVLVRAHNGRISGIVTATDITQRFDVTAWPFFVVGEIELRLRKCLGAKISEDAIRAVQQYGQTGKIADLQFGDYVKLLDGDQRNKNGQRKEAMCAAADQNWQALGWTGVNRVQFVHQLDRVRHIRNKIAHFDAEPMSPQRSEELRQFVGLLRQLT
ncbi:CBS domain-containing protein [Streptomyces sp. NBC_00365]|uniref:CBS domain-containing protein n=1 Tax=Streptomyces sp. NBC_00365 TaxID=2975726 RepID=UPI0022531888|nr:CBS domain-containing protein [Streptomyces sp. NBC_00365]MCX5089894.1 CBS domain-containing protein [Streptomyces sp. NBC_00365]